MAEIEYVDYTEQARKRSTNLLKNSPIFYSLLKVLMKPVNESQADFIWLSQNLLNLDVAENYHLDIIGQVVGQSRILASFETGFYFGFKNAYQSDTFGDENNSETGGYWVDGSKFNTATATTLNDEQYKRVIKARIIKNNLFTCTHDELIEVVNLLTGRNDHTIYTKSHGNIVMQISGDPDGLLSYFLSRIENKDNILPIPFGVSVEFK